MARWRVRLAGGLASALLLAATTACTPTGGAGGRGTSLAMFGGTMHAAAPAGYCVDRNTSRERDDRAVILMGRCAGATAAAPALITVSLGAPGSAEVLRRGARAMSEYFTSPAGRAALARDGKAASVRVLRASVADDALLLRVEDAAAGDHWRAITGLRGRLVTIAVTAPQPGGAPGTVPDSEAMRHLLEQALAAMRRANPPRGS